MRIIIVVILLSILSLSCKEDKQQSETLTYDSVPITTVNEEAKKHFKQAQFLVQNGLDAHPIMQYQKAIALDSTFVRMYNFISIYAPNDSIKKSNHELAKKYKHLVSEAEQLLVDATEYRFEHPNDHAEKLLFKVAELYPSDKYIYHTICFLLFRKNPSLAITAGKKSIAIDPNYGSGYNILGYAYMRNDELEKAEKAFDNYIRCEPNKGNPYDSKADVLLLMGRYKEALILKQKAYTLDTTLNWIPDEIIDIKKKIK
ncbi:hypothetical protein [Dokdonia sp.]|uniref:tetratricopeptide repeat protein n=1 Tax=Dokdonia sp. TaxID=2024995 RepID=UPI003263FF6B